ncbi:MAG: hypothetical protein AABX04_08515 [Nanoarchaeota archaeon]
MDTDKKNSWWGYLPLVALIVVAFSVANPYLFQNSLDSSSPNSYHANDAYAHLAYIVDVLKVGNYNHEAQFYIGFNGAELSPREPPLLFFYIGFLSNLLRIQPHVAALFGLFLGLILAISTIYIILKKYSLTWAIAFLPLTLFLFTFPFSALITWGFWKACTMYFILVTSLMFFVSKLDWKKVPLLVILVSSLILASPALLPYFLLLLGIKLILEKKEFKTNLYLLAAAGISTLIITFHYFLNYSLARTATGQNKIMDMLGFMKGYELYGANAYASHFGMWWYMALIGFVYALIYLFQDYKNREAYNFKVMILFLLLFIIFLLPAIGVTRIYQFRLLWPLFVAVLAGLAIYLGLTFAKKVKNFSIEWGAVVISAILIIGMLNYLPFSKTNQAITSSEQWDAYIYVHQQTPKNSTLLLVDSVMSQESIMLSSGRRLYYYAVWEMQKMLENKDEIKDTPPAFYCAIPEKSRTGFSIHTNEKLIQWCKEKQGKNIPSCAYDYIYINKQFSSQAQVDLMKNFIGSINMSNFEKVKEGAQVLLLKNKQICTNKDVEA